MITKIVDNSKIWFYAIVMVFMVGMQSCHNDDAVSNSNNDGWLKVLPLALDFNATGGMKDIYLVLTNDINPADVTYEVSENGQAWCSLQLEDNYLHVTTRPNYYESTRSTMVTINYGNYSRKVPISQEAAVGDQLIPVVSGVATSEETVSEDRGLSMSFDGDQDTYFNSKFGEITTWPFQIEYTLEKGHTLNRIVYYPRTDAGNKWGSFNEFDVWASTVDAPNTFTKVGSYARGDANHNVTIMTLATPVQNVAKVRFDIHSAFNNRISCAEMEFYQAGTTHFDYTAIFKDDTYSELKDGITEAEIKAIPDETMRNLALDLLVNEYVTDFRVAAYRPYQNPAIQSAINKTSPYSLRDNPTGIYVEAGDELVVMVGDTKQQNIGLVVQDLNAGFGSSKNYALQEGENRLNMETGGLVYVQNLTNDNIPLILKSEADKAAAAAKTVNIHFVNAKVNGYFDLTKHTQDDWSALLAKAPYQDIDVLGTRAHITWTTENFRSFNTDIISVLEKYDRLVYLQEEFAGLEKYHKTFNNRMYFHIDYNGASPYATNNRTAYTAGYAEIFCNANRFEARLWGPAHEVGHMNQLRPSLKWTGTTEVTNNILSIYTQTQFGETSKLLADGTYAEAKAKIIDTQAPHVLDNASNEFMVKLVPFWQLKLYMVDALGKEDFYKDLFEHYRVTNALNTGNATEGVLQLDFVRQVCKISGLNMIDFFQKWGFLTPVNKTINDYGNKTFIITQEQIDALIAEINAAGYAMPSPNVEDIQDDNINLYK